MKFLITKTLENTKIEILVKTKMTRSSSCKNGI